MPSRRSKPSPKELKLATQIVDGLESEWDPKRYRDTFADELKERILAKDRGDEVVEEAGEPERSADVVDLMEAIEASVQDAKSARRPKGRARDRRKSA